MVQSNQKTFDIWVRVFQQKCQNKDVPTVNTQKLKKKQQIRFNLLPRKMKIKYT